MKRAGNQQTLGDVIKEYLSRNKLDDKLTEVKLLGSWEKTMGKTIARYTKEMYIKEGILYLVISSSVLREELFFARDKIKNIMNKEAGKEIIREVILR